MLPAYFHPEQMASTHLDKDRYEAFAKTDFLMEVYTPMPTRNVSDNVREKYKARQRERMYDGHMSVYRFSMFREGKNPILRCLRYILCFIKQFYFGLRAKDIDIIYLVSTPPIQGILGCLLKKIKKVPFVYNLQDIFPDSLVGTGLAKEKGFLWKIGRAIENYTYRNADKIIAISEDFKKNLMNKGVPSEKISIVYNWVDDKSIIPVSKENNSLYDELDISKDKFNVVYAGNFGNAQNIDVTIAAAELLQDEVGIQFLLFGTGGMVDHYKQLVSNKGLTNIKFYPLQPIEKVSYVYSLGDLGIVACKKGLGKGAFPSKTWSIMATGTPVIANYDKDTDLERLIIENHIGVFSEAGDSKQMADGIMSMYRNPEICKEYGLNARKYIEKYVSTDISTNKYISEIITVCNANN